MATVEVSTQELTDILKTFGLRETRLGPQMESIAQDLVVFVDDQFRSGGDGKWQPLSEPYLEWKLEQGKTATPLTFNGYWSGSIRAEFDDQSASTSTNVPYAVYHASKEPRTKIPYRSPYDLDDATLDDAAERIAHFIATGDVT